MDLISVFHDTQRYIKKDLMKPAEIYQGLLTDFQPRNDLRMKIYICDENCINVAYSIKMEHPESTVCMLNMCSDYCPGGGVKKGSHSQEECICRCTSLYPSLNSHSRTGYPMTQDQMFWTDCIQIIKTGDYTTALDIEKYGYL